MILKKYYIKPFVEFSFIEEDEGLLENTYDTTAEGSDSPWDNEEGEAKSSFFDQEEENVFSINQ